MEISVECEHKQVYENALKGYLGINNVNEYLDGFRIEGKDDVGKFKINEQISFDIKKICTLDNDSKFPEVVKITDDSEVWFLVGETTDEDSNESKIQVLQLAANVNIKKEIEGDLKKFRKKPVTETQDDEDKTEGKGTQFWYGVPVLKCDRKNVYSKMYSDLLSGKYQSLSIYSICRVEKYEDLETLLIEKDSEQFKKIKSGMKFLWDISENKRYILEALFAFYTQALYWNLFRGKVDQKVINIMLGIDRIDLIRVKKGYWEK